jgi:multicomponent Na+:H+ antiporter subunit D
VTALGWVVVLPLLGGCAAFLTGRGRGRWIGLATAGATVAATGVLLHQVWSFGPVHHALGGWAPPLGITLYADGIAVVLIATTLAVMIGIGAHAAGYHGSVSLRWFSPHDSFWPLALLLWAALNSLFLARDLFNAYVALELLTLLAVALVALDDEDVSLFAATRYLLAAFLGSIAYLLGVVLLYGAYDTLDLALLAERVGPSPAAAVALALMIGGLALKTALFPLHFWLPRAHASAPTPVSALLSALVILASFQLVVRIWMAIVPDQSAWYAGQFLGAAGAGAIVWGSIQAIRQQRLKLLVAYSTVAHVGYLFLIFPLVAPAPGTAADAVPWAPTAWTGGIYHAVSHAFAKAAMFLAAGTIVRSLGSDRIVGISGIATHLPLSTYAFGIAGLTLIGLPPSGGFIAKWLLLSAAVQSGQWWWAIVILLGGVLTAGYVFLVLGQELTRGGEHTAREFKPVPRVLGISAITLALISMALGLRAVEPLELLRIGLPGGVAP